MEYILLLTACINPDGMPFTCLADVGVRKKQYIEALNFYLKNTTRKIVFVENSGTDISSSFKDFQHRIEFLCFDGNLCFDKRKGKGYGEALILEYAMAKSEFITDDVLIFKLTGRLQLINLKSATTRLYDTEAKIICIVSKKGAQCIECHHKDI